MLTAKKRIETPTNRRSVKEHLAWRHEADATDAADAVVT
jgi:hypothetical protein